MLQVDYKEGLYYITHQPRSSRGASGGKPQEERGGGGARPAFAEAAPRGGCAGLLEIVNLLVALSCIDLSGMRGCVGFFSTKVGFVSTKRECGAGTAARRPVPPRLSGRAANDAPAMGEAFGDRRIG